MGVRVDVFLDVKGVTFGFQFDRNIHIHRLIISLVLVILNIAAREFSGFIREFALLVHQRQ